MRVSSSLSLLLLVPGCIVDYIVGEPGKPRKPGQIERVDVDQDGFTEEEGDCNDDDALQAPGLKEACDTLDNDCNGIVDWGESELDPCQITVEQLQTLRADVLIVIDISESMEEHWTPSADGAVEMLKHLVGKGHDTHVGVITTDMESPEQGEFESGEGRLVETLFAGIPRRYIKGSDDFFDASMWLTLAITNHAPMADGKEGVRAALDASMTRHEEGWNSGFLRADANLTVVILSDDEDSSLPGTPQINALLDAYEDEGHTTVKVHGVIQDAEGETCGGQEPAASLHQLVTDWMGTEWDVCEEDYKGFLAGVGQNIVNEALHDSVALPEPAIPDTVQIFIQEEGPVDAYPWVGEIGLSQDSRTVYFLDDKLPPAGTNIIVKYRAEAEPPVR